jgi:hypothetical protein
MIWVKKCRWLQVRTIIALEWADGFVFSTTISGKENYNFAQ